MNSREFLQSLQVNDLIRMNGKLRVIRSVSWRQWRQCPPTGYFTFAILRCSWTRRSTTTIKSTDLHHRRIELVARNYQSKHPLAAMLNEDARDPHSKLLQCCDVIGVLT